MNRQIGHVFAIILGALLSAATAHARYLNPNTGRFQTMDTYEGNTQDPASLHKYLYGKANPVNRLDPSGHESIVSVLTAASVQGAMAQLGAVPPSTVTASVAGLGGPNITQAIVDHLNAFVSQPQGNLNPSFVFGARQLRPFAIQNGHQGSFGQAVDQVNSGLRGTVTLGDMIISALHIRHILIMTYLAESYGTEQARAAGQYQESFWLGFFTEGQSFEGSSNPDSEADLRFNEVAIKLSTKLKHKDANGGATDRLTLQEVLEVTKSVTASERQAIAQKPARRTGTLGYQNLRPNPRAIPAPQGLLLPPIDL